MQISFDGTVFIRNGDRTVLSLAIYGPDLSCLSVYF